MANILLEGPNQAFKRFSDMGDGTHAERIEIAPVPNLVTDEGGIYTRLSIEVGRTCFFSGRQLFTFLQYSVPTGGQQVIKVVAPVDTLVQAFGANLNVAALRIELVVGGTEGGTFNTPLPILKTNNMTTAGNYSAQVTMSTGGTHTGGTILDMLELFSGTPARQAQASNASEDQPIGFAPGTFYVRLINTDGATATGIFRARWEERP